MVGGEVEATRKHVAHEARWNVDFGNVVLQTVVSTQVGVKSRLSPSSPLPPFIPLSVFFLSLCFR